MAASLLEGLRPPSSAYAVWWDALKDLKLLFGNDVYFSLSRNYSDSVCVIQEGD